MSTPKTPQPYATVPLVKQPTEVWPFTMPCARLLAGKTIASVTEIRFWKGTWPDAPKTTAIADPENPAAGDLQLDDSSTDGSLVELVLSGGTDGDDYYLEIDVTTSDGYVRSADGWLLIRDQRQSE